MNKYLVHHWRLTESPTRCSLVGNSSLICKGTFGFENIEYKKTFAETLRSVVNILRCDCYDSCLYISVDLACKQYFFVEVVLSFCSVANWLEEIAKVSCIVFWSNPSVFKGFSIVTLCIEFFSIDEVRSLSFSSVNKSHL